MDDQRRLTPEQVRNKIFGTVRWREGYAMAEVDTFLGEIENALRRDRTTTDAAALLADARETAALVVARAERQAEQILADARARAAEADRELVTRAAALDRAAQDHQRLERVSAFLRGQAHGGGLNDQLAQLQALLDELGGARGLVPAQVPGPGANGTVPSWPQESV